MERDAPPFTYGYAGPLQDPVFTALYASLMVISITVIILAAPYLSHGISVWSAATLRPIDVWMGGLANVLAVPSFVVWFFSLFIFAHIHMAVWNSIRWGMKS